MLMRAIRLSCNRTSMNRSYEGVYFTPSCTTSTVVLPHENTRPDLSELITSMMDATIPASTLRIVLSGDRQH